MPYIIVAAVEGSDAYVLDEFKHTYYGPYPSPEEAEADIEDTLTEAGIMLDAGDDPWTENA